MNSPEQIALAMVGALDQKAQEAAKKAGHSSADAEQGARSLAQTQAKPEAIQTLSAEALNQIKALAGFGSVQGRWQTPREWASSAQKGQRDIDIAQRIEAYLAKEPAAIQEALTAAPAEQLANLTAQGVHTVTRLALLSFLVPSGKKHGARRPLRPPTIGQLVYQYWPPLMARAIGRRLAAGAGVGPSHSSGLLRWLTGSDLAEFEQTRDIKTELERLQTLTTRGLWWDSPAQPTLPRVSDPSSRATAPTGRRKSNPYAPLPDEWLSEIGPRLLWVVEEMTPTLLDFLEALPGELTRVNWGLTSGGIKRQRDTLLAEMFTERPWLSRSGAPLQPPFSLQTASAAAAAGKYEWPPRNWDHLQTLSLVAQGAHLTLTLLMLASRIGEVKNLRADCAEVSGSKLRGHTYKLSSRLTGEERSWPAPPLLAQCLGQQKRLARVWSLLPESLEKGLPTAPRFEPSRLWVSITGSADDKASADVAMNIALTSLAKRLGVSAEPGGIALHAHRFRKTVARLVGVSLWQSPLVVKRILGHKCVEMALHYILSDPAIREDVEKVLRELRVMHCAETIEEIHQALEKGLPPPAHGGEGGKRLVEAVITEDKRLKADDRVWGGGSAYDLAVLLSDQGNGWQIVRPGVMCARAPGEPGMCKSERFGQPNVSSCQPDCGQRVQLVSSKRDTAMVIEQYISLAESARADGHIMLIIEAFTGLDSLIRQFPDLEKQYDASYAQIKQWVDEAHSADL
jgi:integrase